jgi:hypothetical protein
MAFVKAVGATHVLVNPRTYQMMTRVLGATPDLFRRLCDDGQWAVYVRTGR